VTTSPPTRERRRYDSTLRQARAAATRDRIVAAATELLRGSPIRDWHAVTIRAVAARAGVNERTVYRHFANERALRDAVMQRFESESGIDLARLQLGDVGDAAARIFAVVSRYPLEPRRALDPTFAEVNQRQHDALLGAVAAGAPEWSEADRRLAAAMLDVFWSVGAYERLVVDWELDHDDAVHGITWVLDLVTAAIRDGRAPTA